MSHKKLNYQDKIFNKSSEKMVELPDESIDLVITSPPYNINVSFGNEWKKRHDYLFKTQKRTQFKAQSMQLLIKGICNEGNVFGVTSHSIRRTFITGLSNKMINARVIQKLARHSSLAVTQLYIETNDSQLLNAVNL